MGVKIVKVPQPAGPDIRRVLDEFLEAQRTRLAPRTPAPEPATRWLRPGWTISCSLGRVRESWRLLDVANVYPA